MTNFTSVLDQLQLERSRLSSQLESINEAVSALNGIGASRGAMSAAGRARVAAAQRARWAKLRGVKVVSIGTSKRRTMSPAARRRVAAAQRARWAKWRKDQKRD
jgi:hypothetical protein